MHPQNCQICGEWSEDIYDNGGLYHRYVCEECFNEELELPDGIEYPEDTEDDGGIHF